MLMEQAIQNEAVKIAATYTVDATHYKEVAQDLRQPYWDWALHSLPPPEVISMEEAHIVHSDGRKLPVKNPLRRYTFHPKEPSFPAKYPWNTTFRYLRPVASPNATERVDLLINNHTAGEATNNSLEIIHDSVHDDIGGEGNMGDTTVAAFDPIFWMHHAQVDRLLSLWSILYPGTWVSPSKSEEGTWTRPIGVPINKHTELTPFWNANPTYWTSSSVTTTATLGYTYPDYNNLPSGDPAVVQAAIGRRVNELYGGPILNQFPPIVRIPVSAPTEPEKTDNDRAMDVNQNGGSEPKPVVC
ncbi:hypothetical protein PM082_020872 [Marasmius tenuissimus]|nr:hypothetical protein PM082_020872 [Marasmius tenuissimus]